MRAGRWKPRKSPLEKLEERAQARRHALGIPSKGPPSWWLSPGAGVVSHLRFSPTRVKNWCRNIGNGFILAAQTLGVMVFDRRLPELKADSVRRFYHPGAPTGLTQTIPADFWGRK